MATLTATGLSGQTYSFETYPLNTNFNPIGAIYVFLRGTTALYVGKAKDLCNRMSNHHKEDEARRHGANQIAVMVVHSEVDRDRIERDLIPALQPTCNELLK